MKFSYQPVFPAAVVLLYQISASGIAQEIPVGADPESRSAHNQKMYRVEVKGRPQSEIETRRRSSVAKQIYGREEMDKYGDANLSEVMRRLPGVEVQGGRPRLRGLGAGYSQLLINGEPAPNGFSLEQLSPAQVERIEISKAPRADQSAQAVAGSVNVILKTAPRKRQLDMRLGAAYARERPTPNASIIFGERSGNLSFSLPISAFEWRSGADLEINRRLPGVDNVLERSSQRASQPMWGHSVNSSPQLSWKISDDNHVTLQAFLQRGYWNSKVQFANIAATSATLLEDPSLNKGSFENQRLSSQWRHRWSDTQDLELRLSIGEASDRFSNTNFKSNETYRLSEGRGSDRSALQSGKYTQAVGDKHSFSAGWELERRERVDDRTVRVRGEVQLPGIDGTPFSARIDRRAFYIQDEWEISDRWMIYGGVRHEAIRTQSDSSSVNVDNISRVLTPLLHLNYKLDPKGRDMLRASVTRSYKAPDLHALVARPSLSSLYPFPDQTNNDIAPDRAGNAALRPELATGLDLAFETYLKGGGFMSVGVFHRKVKDLVRYVNTLETVDWATAPRWVTRPQNFSAATSSGIELEVKGKAGELMPAFFDGNSGLNVRWALNLYKSHVEAVPGRNSRLDGQQPWSTILGFDYKMKSLPLTFGSTMAYTPGYVTRQTLSQTLEQSQNRALDLYAQYVLSKQASLRLAVTNAAPLAAERITATASGAQLQTLRKTETNYSLTLDVKL